MFQFCPDGASLEQRQTFQTELLELMMDIIHMLSQDNENNTHLNSQGRIVMHVPSNLKLTSCPCIKVSCECTTFLYLTDLSQRPEGQMGMLMENVVLFTKTLLHKLYSGTFLGDSDTLLNFLTDQIVVVRHRHRNNSYRYLINNIYIYI